MDFVNFFIECYIKVWNYKCYFFLFIFVVVDGLLKFLVNLFYM